MSFDLSESYKPLGQHFQAPSTFAAKARGRDVSPRLLSDEDLQLPTKRTDLPSPKALFTKAPAVDASPKGALSRDSDGESGKSASDSTQPNSVKVADVLDWVPYTQGPDKVDKIGSNLDALVRYVARESATVNKHLKREAKKSKKLLDYADTIVLQNNAISDALTDLRGAIGDQGVRVDSLSMQVRAIVQHLGIQPEALPLPGSPLPGSAAAPAVASLSRETLDNVIACAMDYVFARGYDMPIDPVDRDQTSFFKHVERKMLSVEYEALRKLSSVQRQILYFDMVLEVSKVKASQAAEAASQVKTTPVVDAVTEASRRPISHPPASSPQGFLAPIPSSLHRTRLPSKALPALPEHGPADGTRPKSASPGPTLRTALRHPVTFDTPAASYLYDTPNTHPNSLKKARSNKNLASSSAWRL